MYAASPSGASTLAKPHERVHLVDVAMDRLRHRAGRMDIDVARVVEQMRRRAQPPQDPVQQRKALRFGMQHDLLRQRDEALRHVELRRVDGRQIGDIVGGEEVAAVARHAPDDPVRRDTGEHGSPRGFAPAVEIGLRGEGDGVHDKPRLVRLGSQDDIATVGNPSERLRPATARR